MMAGVAVRLQHSCHPFVADVENVIAWWQECKENRLIPCLRPNLGAALIVLLRDDHFIYEIAFARFK